MIYKYPIFVNRNKKKVYVYFLNFYSRIQIINLARAIIVKPVEINSNYISLVFSAGTIIYVTNVNYLLSTETNIL